MLYYTKAWGWVSFLLYYSVAVATASFFLEKSSLSMLAHPRFWTRSGDTKKKEGRTDIARKERRRTFALLSNKCYKKPS